MNLVGIAFRYACVGVLGTIIHVGIMVLLVEVFSIRPAVSSTIGFIVTVIVSYFLNLNWTFGHKALSHWAFAKYVVVSCIGVVLTFGLMTLAIEVLEWHYLYGQILVVIAIPTTNFILNYFWTFSSKTTTAGAGP